MTKKCVFFAKNQNFESLRLRNSKTTIAKPNLFCMCIHLSMIYFEKIVEYRI